MRTSRAKNKSAAKSAAKHAIKPAPRHKLMKQQLDEAVKKVVEEYGDVLQRLGKE